MRFSIRDGLWITAAVAFTSGWIVYARQQKAYVLLLEEQVAELETRSLFYKREASEARKLTAELEDRADRSHREQREEIFDLRHLLKQSLQDKRKWLEVKFVGNRIVAIYPATRDSAPITANTVREVENLTGRDGTRLRHFMTPIHQLRPQSGSSLSVD